MKFHEISLKFQVNQITNLNFTIQKSLNLNSVAEIPDLSCEISEPYLGGPLGRVDGRAQRVRRHVARLLEPRLLGRQGDLLVQGDPRDPEGSGGQ